jgi:hypothetical protein
MARVRFAEIVVAAAVAGSLAACGGSSSKAATAPVTVTSTVQAPASSASSATTAPASSPAGTTASDTAPSSADTSTQPPVKSSSTAADGGGVANAGDQVTIVGTLHYLAPGKFLVHPDDGSADQGFYVADSTKILGAAVICGPDNGTVTIGGDGYGTTKCTEEQLETAAKKDYVKVRITMDRKTGTVATVEEKYHP